MSGLVRPSRAARGVRARRWRRLELLVVVLVVVVGVRYSSGLGGAGPAAAASQPPPSGGGAAVSGAVLSVTDAGHALLAAVDQGPPVSAIALPPRITVVLPGQGDVRTDDLSSLTGPSVQVGVSNVLGTWVDHYAVLDLNALGAIVERTGGIRVDLTDAVTLGTRQIGPGTVKLDGPSTVALLAPEVTDAYSRWRAVLAGLLDARPRLVPEDLAEVDDFGAVQTILAGARGARFVDFSTVPGSPGVRIPRYDRIDQALSDAWGTPVPTPVIVQNGSGVPGVGQEVARLLIPAGFRVVRSEDAASQGHATTEVVAMGETAVPAARRARRALGIGRVGVTGVPSDVGDITIVVGKDFTV